MQGPGRGASGDHSWAQASCAPERPSARKMPPSLGRRTLLWRPGAQSLRPGHRLWPGGTGCREPLGACALGPPLSLAAVSSGQWAPNPWDEVGITRSRMREFRIVVGRGPGSSRAVTRPPVPQAEAVLPPPPGPLGGEEGLFWKSLRAPTQPRGLAPAALTPPGLRHPRQAQAATPATPCHPLPPGVHLPTQKCRASAQVTASTRGERGVDAAPLHPRKRGRPACVASWGQSVILWHI